LHPEGFRDVGNRLREAMQGGGTRLQSSGEALPPDIKVGTVKPEPYGVSRSLMR
jgi:hypothetical protein